MKTLIIRKPLIIVYLGLASASAWATEPCFDLLSPLSLAGEQKRAKVCKSEIPALMKKRFISYLGYEMEWPRLEEKRVQIDSCEKYLTIVGFGQYASSRADYGVEEPYLRTCGILAVLSISGPTRQRLYKQPKEVLGYKNLPPTLLPAATSDQYQELVSATDAGKSISDFIVSGDESHKDIRITLLATADITGDGIEDYIVVKTYGTATDGSITIGYLSPRLHAPVARWVYLDHTMIKWPNPSFEPTQILPR
jgi:hypothetical protein